MNAASVMSDIDYGLLSKLVEWLAAIFVAVLGWFYRRLNERVDELRDRQHEAKEERERRINGLSARLEPQIENLRKQIDGHDSRITITEQALLHAPKADDLRGLRDEMHKLGVLIARLQGAQEAHVKILKQVLDGRDED